MNIFTITRNSVKGRCMLSLKQFFKSLAVLSVALLFAGAATLSAQNVNITVTPAGKNLGQLIPEITKQTGMEFSYDVELLKVRASGQGTLRGSLDDVLDKMLAGTGIKYTITGNRIYLAREDKPAQTASGNTPQRQYRLNGVVKSDDGDALVGVTVVESPYNAVVTGNNGEFSINVSSGSQLTFSYIGYEDVVESVGGRTSINVVMREKATGMEEVVVVGYRTVKKVSLLGSVASVDMAQKEKQVLSNAGQALYSTPGVWVNQAGAKPGRDGSTIRIQGQTSINGGSPLVLLDGIEYDINEIDPGSIESISVLKDVSAAIYGNKASHGVVLITSKRGAKGKPRIEYSGKAGIQAPTMLPDIETDPIKYMKLRNLAEINSGVNPSAVNYTQAQIDEYQAGMKLDPSVYPASDWFDICLRNGFVQQHNLRLSGGVDALTYTIGLGYTDQTGILIANDDAQRYGLDFKLDARVNDKLKVGATFQGNIRKFNEVGYGTSTIMNVMTRALPIFSDYHKNGLYGSTWLFTPGRNNIENPRMEVEQGFTFRDYQELLSTIYTEWNITKDIKYFATFGFRKYDHFSKDFIPQMYTVNPKTGDTKLFNSNTPRLKEWDSMMQQITFSHRVVWEKTFAEKHDAHLMIGNEYFDYQARNFQAYNHGFNDNTLHEFGALTDQTNAQATGGSAFKRDVSVFGRAAYTYDEKYMLEATLRYDGSSLLAPGYRWALFPSALLGWRIDRESFFNVRQIDLLKIRLSAGVLGNPSVSNYAYQMTYDPISQNYSFGGNIASGYAVSALTDETLTWEKTSTYNVGIDFTAFRHRFTLEANLAYKHTSGMLLTLTIPDHVGGLSGPKSNVGTMENKGFEVMASWRDNISNFSYGVSGSVSYFKNKVLELNTDQILSNGDRNITKVGYPHNSFYLLEAVGYYQSQAEIDDPNTPIYGGSRANLKPGYIRYADKNNDKIIDVDNDKIITGNSIPFLTYSFNLHLGYKNISLDAMFQGIGDCYVYPTNNIAFPFYNGAGVTRDWETESWSENNRNAKYPLLTISNTTKANFEDSTHWLHNTKYLRMKNVQLTYSFPEKWLSRAKIDRLQLYLSGQNLLTFTNFKLWDPEIATNATNIYQYPNMKTVSIGLNLTF